MSVIQRLNAALSGRYRIERELGEGGMATVYLADDVRHERRVALKVLKPELAAVVGAERFLAEIKTTANLQHPHILPLFDSGEADSFLFYVMPYVEGETLRDRLERERQLPIDEAVMIATKVAAALGAAHGHGVIHRDIKPANILLAAGEPLVADFGIALAVGAAGRGRLTETGLSLGTPHYMSPEQATGESNVGPPADIYALGCVLYEMLAGEAPYTGGSAQAILGKIVTGEAAPVTKLRPNVPANVDAAIRAALERVPADRPANARELARALSDPAFRHGAERTPDVAGRAGPSRLVPWLVAAVAVVVAAISWGSRGTPTAARPLSAFVAVTLQTSGVDLTTMVDRFAVTPAGDAIVYVSEDPASGDRMLWVRRLNELEPQRLAVAGGSSPVISPDGAWVAFSDGGELVKVPIDGSAPPLPLARVQSPRDLTWGSDGVIRFARASGRRPLYAVSDGGGPLDSLVFQGDTAAWRAEALPGGRLLLSLLVGKEYRIVVREEDGSIRPLTDGMDARLAPSGFLLFSKASARGWALIAAPFDPRRAVIDGPERVLAADVPVAYVTPAAGTLSGDLYYIAGQRSERRVEVLDQKGVSASAGLEPGSWINVQASPDGRRVVATLWNGAVRTLWVTELGGGTATQLTFEDQDRFRPHWSPDGRRIAFTYFPRNAVGRESTTQWWLASDGRGDPEPIGNLMDAYPEGFSPNGDILYFLYLTGTATGMDLWTADLTQAEAELRPLLATRARETDPTPSPDGRWLAYETDASGQEEIRIARLPDVGDPVQVTAGGGDIVGWRGDGRRFYYREGTNIWEVEVGPERVSANPPVVAFTVPAETVSASITPDGQRLIVLRGGPMYSELVVRQGVLVR